jgi:hypothetical protein
LINDIYVVEMKAHYVSDAEEKGMDHFNVGHVFAGVFIPRLGGELQDLVVEAVTEQYLIEFSQESGCISPCIEMLVLTMIPMIRVVFVYT